jgi:hypothetical protein
MRQALAKTLSLGTSGNSVAGAILTVVGLIRIATRKRLSQTLRHVPSVLHLFSQVNVTEVAPVQTRERLVAIC